MDSLKGPMRAKKSRAQWDLFDRMLAVQDADLRFQLRGVCSVPWADFFLNPRRLRGSDFLMRWSQGVWSEHRVIEAVNASGEYLAIPYGLSSVAPDNDPRETELYFDRLDAAGLGDRKRPDILVFRKSDGDAVQAAVASAGGEKELPFIPEDDPRMQMLLSRTILAVECEQSLWVARRMPDFGKPLKPMKRLHGRLGLPKTVVGPTIIIKEEDRRPLREWQMGSGLPIHIWTVFYDLAYGIALDRAEELIEEGLIEPKEQNFQAPGGASQSKRTYRVYCQYAYPVGESTQEPSLVAAHIMDANGHILPYVRSVGGTMRILPEALQQLRLLAESRTERT